MVVGFWLYSRSQWIYDVTGVFVPMVLFDAYIDALAQDCSISNANAMEILQYCTKPSICAIDTQRFMT